MRESRKEIWFSEIRRRKEIDLVALEIIRCKEIDLVLRQKSCVTRI
jgi:hypothetical protein